MRILNSKLMIATTIGCSAFCFCLGTANAGKNYPVTGSTQAQSLPAANAKQHGELDLQFEVQKSKSDVKKATKTLHKPKARTY